MLSLRKRMWIIRRKEKDDWDVKRICAHARISRDTFYYHWNNYRRNGPEGLELKSKRPLNVRSAGQELVGKVIGLRKQFRWGPNKIAGYLRNKGMPIGDMTAYRILCRSGLNNPLDYQRRTWGNRRFERTASNSLWQADFMLTDRDLWMLTFIDDHSRFVVGSKIYDDATSENVIRLLCGCIRAFGHPREILTDQGTQFHSVRGGMSELDRFCVGRDILHIVASKRRPTTTGKIEAFHKSYQLESPMFKTHGKYLRYYNYRRPHQSLGYLYPADIYFKDRV